VNIENNFFKVGVQSIMNGTQYWK